MPQVLIQQNVPALLGGRFPQPVLNDGIITSINFNFPLGCNGLVDVFAGRNNERFYPEQGFISLNDASPVYAISHQVKAGDVLWAEIHNGDAANPHQITVVFTIQNKE